jgi:hypothetical protein
MTISAAGIVVLAAIVPTMLMVIARVVPIVVAFARFGHYASRGEDGEGQQDAALDNASHIVHDCSMF